MDSDSFKEYEMMCELPAVLTGVAVLLFIKTKLIY